MMQSVLSVAPLVQDIAPHPHFEQTTRSHYSQTAGPSHNVARCEQQESEGPALDTMPQNRQAIRCGGVDQPFHSFGKNREYKAQPSGSDYPRATKHVPKPALPSPRSTPEPDGVRLTPASMRTDLLDYQQLHEQPHGDTPASDVTSQPAQLMHSLGSGNSSSCTASAVVRVPTSPDEDNTAESPAKGLPDLHAEQPFLPALPLQTIMEKTSASDTSDIVRMGKKSSSPSGKHRIAAATYITPVSSWGELSPAHTVGELANTQQPVPSEVLATYSPATAQRLTPCLKRSRSVVADVGGSNAFCMSTGYTVRQPVDTALTVRPTSSPPSVGGCAVRAAPEDAPFPSHTDTSCNMRPASAPHYHQVQHDGANSIHISTGSLGALQQELTLATPPCDDLQAPEHAVEDPCSALPQHALNLTSYTVQHGDEVSVHNPAFMASGASGTNWGANGACDGLNDSRQEWLGSAHAGSSCHQPANLDKSLFAPLVSPCGDENDPPSSTSTELVAWSPQPDASHKSYATADNACSAVVVAASQREPASPSPVRTRQFSPLPDDRISEVQIHDASAPRPMSVAVQCGQVPSLRTGFRTAVVRCTDLEDAVNSAMPHRQLQGPLATQAMGMLDDEAKAAVEPCMGFLQSAVARLEDTAARTHELNAQLSATRAELRAAEFELKVVRAESAAALREVRACQRENDCLRKAGFSCIKALEEELADACTAREVLALALARLLRDTKARRTDVFPDARASANPVAALEAQLNSLSVHDSTISSPAMCNQNVITSSLAAARQILGAHPDVPVALQSTSPVFMEHRAGLGRQMAAHLGSQVLRFAASCDHSRSPPSYSPPPPDDSTAPPLQHTAHAHMLPLPSAEQLLMTSSTDGMRQASPVRDGSASAPPFQHVEDPLRCTESPMSNPMRTPSSMADSAVGFGNALPGLSPIHAPPTSPSPVDDGGSPLAIGGPVQAEQAALVPTRAHTPDCFMDRMYGAASGAEDAAVAVQDVAALGSSSAPKYQRASLLSHFKRHSGASLCTSLSVPDNVQQHQLEQQPVASHPPFSRQHTNAPGQEKEYPQPGSKDVHSGKGRLHIPAHVSDSKDESNNDSSQAWQRSLGMSYVADLHTAPFSVLPKRPSASQDVPAVAEVHSSNDRHAQKELRDLNAAVPPASPAVDPNSRPAHTLLTQRILIDADVHLTAARERVTPATNQIPFQPYQHDQPAAADEPTQHRPVLDVKEFGGSRSSQQLLGPGIVSPPRAAPGLAVYPDIAASPEVDDPAQGGLPSESAQAAAQEVRRFCAMAGQQGAAQPWDVEERVRGQQIGKSRVAQCVVPVSPDLETARRAQRAAGEQLTASQERVRASMGRKRATVLAGHFGGSYAAKAKALTQARAGTGSGYAALAAKARKRRA